MAGKKDFAFEIGFFEAVLRREPDFTEVIELLGGLYTKAGRIEDGLKMDRKLVRLQPDNATAHYNLACSLALTGVASAALESLARAVALGYGDYKWMERDADLECLRSEPAFIEILAKLKAGKTRP